MMSNDILLPAKDPTPDVSPRLPQELLESVVAFLQDDRDASKACSLAGRLLVRSSQSNLFYRVTLSPKSQRQDVHPCVAFHNVLTSSSHLASYVRELFIMDGTGFHVFDRDGKFWVHNEATLPKVLDALRDISFLSIKNTQFGSGIGWRFIKGSSTGRAAILSLYKAWSRESIKDGVEIQFDRYLPDMDFFRNCPNLLHLRLNSLQLDGLIKEMDVPLRRRNEVPVTLESLAINLEEYSFHWTVKWLFEKACPVDVSTVKHLVILVQDSDQENLINHRRAMELIRSTAHSLESLSLSPSTLYTENNRYADACSLAIDRLPRLRKLAVDFFVSCFNNAKALYWLEKFISKIGPEHVIEEFIIYFKVHMFGPEFFQPRSTSWAIIDRAIEDAPLPKLSRFELVFFDNDVVDDVDFARKMRLLMPCTARRFPSFLEIQNPTNSDVYNSGSCIWKTEYP